MLCAWAHYIRIEFIHINLRPNQIHLNSILLPFVVFCVCWLVSCFMYQYVITNYAFVYTSHRHNHSSIYVLTKYKIAGENIWAEIACRNWPRMLSLLPSNGTHLNYHVREMSRHLVIASMHHGCRLFNAHTIDAIHIPWRCIFASFVWHFLIALMQWVKYTSSNDCTELISIVINW